MQHGEVGLAECPIINGVLERRSDARPFSVSPTPCNSAAQQSVDQSTPTGSHDKRDMAQWRPHRDIASQRKPFSSQQQLLVVSTPSMSPIAKRRRPKRCVRLARQEENGGVL